MEVVLYDKFFYYEINYTNYYIALVYFYYGKYITLIRINIYIIVCNIAP